MPSPARHGPKDLQVRCPGQRNITSLRLARGHSFLAGLADRMRHVVSTIATRFHRVRVSMPCRDLSRYPDTEAWRGPSSPLEDHDFGHVEIRNPVPPSPATPPWPRNCCSSNAAAHRNRSTTCRRASGPQATAPERTFVRHDGEGRLPVTDGPFAETKDLITDWIVIDVDDYD